MLYCTPLIVVCYNKYIIFRNSLSLAMMENLIEAINANKNDTTLRAIVLSATGNVFSAGHNLKELVSNTIITTCIIVISTLSYI